MTIADSPWTVTIRSLDLGPIRLAVSMNAGPRIVSYAKHGGLEFLASLPDAGIDHPDGGYYRFLGGHRLWRSPETPSITYEPDDSNVTISEFDDGADMVGAPDSDGVVKHMSIRQEGDNTVIRHRLVNEGRATVHTAPWAITQMALGGTAILPQTKKQADEHGLLPNRTLVLWPYTDLGAAEFTFGTDRITVEGSTRPSRMKIGQPNRRGWMAYVLEHQVFVKWSAAHDDSATYTDLGASTQIYRDERFVELETIAPAAELAAGDEVAHTEVWRIIEIGDRALDAILAELPEEPTGGVL
jgi:hypothetical protein